MGFYEELSRYSWEEVGREIRSRTSEEVEKALGARQLDPDGMMSLLSPAADRYLERMAQAAHRLTVQRFGRVISMFAPLYVSNVCMNRCVYCGFNAANKVARLTLTPDQAADEARAIHNLGFRHLLLVSGEAPSLVDTEYFAKVARAVRPWFASISVEIYPMDTADYSRLIEAGVDGLVVFQETYDQESYPSFHPVGRKSDFRYRLETPTRGGEAGFRRLGLGALLGLADWRVESFFLGLHARYLLRKYWRSQVGISFPRLRPAAGGFNPLHPVSDRQMVQAMTALRLLLPDSSLVLSTRETPQLRDDLIPLGITSMSAGSHTEPGGYAKESEAEAQFAIADERSPEAVAGVIRDKGYEPVWKDWDAAFLNNVA